VLKQFLAVVQSNRFYAEGAGIMSKRHHVFRASLAIVGVLILLFGGRVLAEGISMLEWRQLRRADAALPQAREDFILMQPHLNTLLHAFPDRSVPGILAPTEHNGEYRPLRFGYTAPFGNRRYNYEDWHTLDWFPQNAIDAAVFLTSSPYLSHTLSRIAIDPFGPNSSTLIAYVDINTDFVVTMVILHDHFNRGHPGDAYAHHQEELGGDYFLSIQVYTLGPYLGRLAVGFGIVIIIIGAVPLGFVIFMRKKKPVVN